MFRSVLRADRTLAEPVIPFLQGFVGQRRDRHAIHLGADLRALPVGRHRIPGDDAHDPEVAVQYAVDDEGRAVQHPSALLQVRSASQAQPDQMIEPGDRIPTADRTAS